MARDRRPRRTWPGAKSDANLPVLEVAGRDVQDGRGHSSLGRDRARGPQAGNAAARHMRQCRRPAGVCVGWIKMIAGIGTSSRAFKASYFARTLT